MTTVTLNEARETIYALLVDNSSLDEANITFPNDNYTSPDGETWVRLIVNHEAGEQDTLGATGNRKFLRRGRVITQIFGQQDQGLQALDTLATEIRDIFEGLTLTGLFFNNVDILEIGSDGEWFQFNVDAPFFYEETK